MAEEQEKPVAEQPFARLPDRAPLLYADQIVNVHYGAFTSKLILALENEPNTVRAVATVVLPTATLFAAAAEILRNLSDPETIATFESRQAAAARFMRQGGREPKAEAGEMGPIAG